MNETTPENEATSENVIDRESFLETVEDIKNLIDSKKLQYAHISYLSIEDEGASETICQGTKSVVTLIGELQIEAQRLGQIINTRRSASPFSNFLEKIMQGGDEED